MDKLYVSKYTLEQIRKHKPEEWSQERFDRWIEETFEIVEDY